MYACALYGKIYKGSAKQSLRTTSENSRQMHTGPLFPLQLPRVLTIRALTTGRIMYAITVLYYSVGSITFVELKGEVVRSSEFFFF